MKKYYTGLCIVKNLLVGDAVTATDMIIEYEESCANSFNTGDQSTRRGVLELIHDVLAESLNETSPEDSFPQCGE